MGRKVLVADDSTVFRQLEARLLETRGYQVAHAADRMIVISTIGREKDRDLMPRGGADDFISKPIDSSNLLRRVGELVSD